MNATAPATGSPGGDIRVLLAGLSFVECPRWFEDQLYFCHWGGKELVAVDLDGRSEVVTTVDSFPFCIEPTPSGELLVVAGASSQLYRLGPRGTLEHRVDLSDISTKPWNEIAVDSRGHVYVNNIGFVFGSEPAGPGHIALVTPDGARRRVAEDLAFPNGMAILDDGATLVVAESHAGQLTAFDITSNGDLANRRVWADLGEAAPDGICADAEGAIWYADVPHGHCVRVTEGGQIWQTVEVGRGAFSCALGGPEGTTLFVTAAEWPGVMDPTGPRTGQILTVAVSVPGVGRAY